MIRINLHHPDLIGLWSMRTDGRGGKVPLKNVAFRSIPAATIRAVKADLLAGKTIKHCMDHYKLSSRHVQRIRSSSGAKTNTASSDPRSAEDFQAVRSLIRKGFVSASEACRIAGVPENRYYYLRRLNSQGKLGGGK